MVPNRRGSLHSRRILALASLLICCLLISGLVAWNLSAAPKLKPAGEYQASLSPYDYNAAYNFDSFSTKTGNSQSLLPATYPSLPSGKLVSGDSRFAPTPIVVNGSQNQASAPGYNAAVPENPYTLLNGQVLPPTPGIAQVIQPEVSGNKNLNSLQAGKSQDLKNSQPPVNLSGPPVGRVMARGNQLIDARGVPYFVAGINYEGHTDRAWLMWQNDKWDPKLIDQNFGQAEAGGYNSVRIFVQTQLRDDIRANYWEKFDKIAELAEKHNLRLLVTFGDYYENDLNKLIEIDSAVARHFANSSAILGYDLRNEPQFGELISLIYPAGQQPPLQTDAMIKVYGERISQADSDRQRGNAPGYLNSRQAYIYQNMIHLYQEFQNDMGSWVLQTERASAMDYLDSPASAKWKPFIDALNGTIQKYIDLRQGAIFQYDPGRLVTIGWNRPDLARMPANHSLGFISLHRFPGDSAGGLAGTLSMLNNLKNYYNDKPVALEEFGYSNSDGKNSIPLLKTASYETAIWLFLYGRGYAGGFKWMLNNFTIGANPYENNFGVTDDNTQPKPAFFAARSALRLANSTGMSGGDFSRLESFDGRTISYNWAGSNALFGNSQQFRDARLQLTQSDAGPWSVWWPNTGEGQVLINTTIPAQVVLDLKVIFPDWKTGMRPNIVSDNGAPVNFEPRGDSSIAFNTQPGVLYSVKTAAQPAESSAGNNP
ncbi:MAG TPA: hypothetical protein VH186_24495 [Chloroflexia bacterium]|nr:hypothetical protein [Chloroflexia bacterium]